MPRIYLSPPHLSGRELEYLKNAVDSNWVAPLGPQVDAFEQELAELVDVPNALALSSGTAALHLALRAVGKRNGPLGALLDEQDRRSDLTDLRERFENRVDGERREAK